MLLAISMLRLIPWLLKLAIDDLKAGAPPERITHLALGMVGAAALGGLCLYLQRWLVIGASRLIEYDLRRDLFHHVQRLDLDFFARQRTGNLMAHFTNDLNAVRDVAGPGVMYAATMTVSLITSLALMIAISPGLTLMAFVPYPLITLVTVYFGRAVHVRSRAVQDLFGQLSSRVQEDLNGVRVIRAYGQEAPSAGNFRRLSLDYLEANMRLVRLRGRFMSVMGALAGSGLAIALLIGGRRVIEGSLSLGSLVAISAYLVELTWPVIAIGFVISNLQRGASAAARLKELLGAGARVTSGNVGGTPEPRLDFENVTFRYPGASRDALRDVSFHLEPGQTLGIVGRTGSGKSTILRLILRFYDPTEGRILIGGVDAREWDLAALRKIIGYAPQDAFLFSRSLAKNIAYGAPDADVEDIRGAADAAHLAAEIAGFPDGLDTPVGERGVTLSGGQGQRTSLARALLLERPLMLLDDTLSSVDADTEARILESLRGYTRKRTSIIVSHRISAVQEADWILVMDEGEVRQKGRHTDLLRIEGLYARLHRRQRLRERLEVAP